MNEDIITYNISYDENYETIFTFSLRDKIFGFTSNHKIYIIKKTIYHVSNGVVVEIEELPIFSNEYVIVPSDKFDAFDRNLNSHMNEK